MFSFDTEEDVQELGLNVHVHVIKVMRKQNRMKESI